MADVLLYRTPWCPFCVRAANLLRRKEGVRIKEVDVSVDRRKREWLAQITSAAAVPQIFIDGIHVGGADELYALEATGQLDELLGLRRQAQA